MLEQKVQTKIECSHCSYTWETKSTKKMVSCPSCMSKTPNKQSIGQRKTTPLFNIVNYNKKLPKPITPVRLANLLTKKQLSQIKSQSLHFIGIKVSGKTYFATLQTVVPKEFSTLLESPKGIVGIPFVMGG